MTVLPVRLRDQLKEHIGSLVNERELLRLIRNQGFLISVGDKVTYTLLKNGIVPRLCVVDFILERKPVPQDYIKTVHQQNMVLIRVKNPPGTLSKELWDALSSVFQELKKGKGPFCLIVEGEEDLASLAAISLAPGDATVIYGLPNKGVVVVPATKEHKQKVNEVLDQMK